MSKALQISSQRTGELFMLLEALLWALFPVLSIVAIQDTAALWAAGGSAIFAALFFAVILTVRRAWGEWRTPGAWKDILWSTALLGIGYYFCIFWGLRHTSAGNASLLMQSEIVFSFLFFGLLKRERQDWRHLLGAAAVICGVTLIFFPIEWRAAPGDLFIVLASAIAPLGNFLQKRVRQKVSASFLLFIRSALSGLVFLLFALWLEPQAEGLTENMGKVLGVLFLNGVFLLGVSKLFWIEAIHRLPVPKAISLAAVGPFFTLIFAWAILGDIPSSSQILALFPITLGIFFLTRQ